MSKRILITSTDLMMVQFLVPHVVNLSDNCYEIEIACSDVGGRMDEIRQKLNNYVRAIYVVRLARSPVSATNLKGYRDMKRVIDAGQYDVIWTNEPVMGVVTRLAARKARKNGTKVLYMVHGFQFFDGAPKKDWLLFYPIEKFASRFCDEIITINREDYQRAERKMHARNVKYIHGIGVDINRFNDLDKQCNIRKELFLSKENFLILSVGELLPRKNQKVIIKALGLLQDKSIHYILCGKGADLSELEQLAKKNNIEKQIHFLGYRKDVFNIYRQVDMLAFPSKREGLGLAGLEAMYCGLPLITSNTSGPRDYMENGKTGFMYDPDDVVGFATGIRRLKEDIQLRTACGEYNRKAVLPFCLDHSKQEVEELFERL